MKPEQQTRRHHRLVPCPHYDVERIESWLTDMASEGLHLEKETSFMGFLAFTRGEPLDVRYRLEPKQKLDDTEKPDHAAQVLYEEYGWEFVADYGIFYIYRALSPDARELNTDPQVQGVSMKAVNRRLILPLIVCILSFRDAMTSIFSEPVRYLVNNGIVYTVGFFLVMMGALYLTVTRLAYFIRLRKKLKDNIPLNHKMPWRKGAFFQRFIKVFDTVFYFAILTVMLTQCTANISNSLQIGAYTGDPSFVTIADLCPEGEYILYNGDTYNTVILEEKYLAPVYMEWHELADVITPEGETIGGRLDVIYYETKSPWIAENLAKEFYERAQGAYAFDSWETPELNVDYAIAYTALNSDYPTIIMQHGNVFVQGYIDIFDENGKNMLEQWAQQMAASMTAA